ncbi:MAG: putative flagellar hook protein FlgE [Microvirga sp.]|jgi:flagellar hook protein FlgE|nr:putative flagellar hook protein FlgE [Microvirga sp.]
MIQAFLNGLSGLLTFSKGLQNVSDNVSNMNTPGFHGSTTFYRNVTGGGEGLGAEIAGTFVRDTQGDLRQTGNSSDAAINGLGFFVIKSDTDQLYFTRAGQFRVGADGYLEDTVSRYRVQSLTNGALTDLSIQSARTLAPIATTKIDFAGNLVYLASSASVNDIKVYDETGATVTLTVTLTNISSTTPDAWSVTVSDGDGQVGTGELRFGPDGSPLTGFNKFDITLTRGGETQTVTLNFGDPGSFGGTTQFSGSSSTIVAQSVDGAAASGLTSFSFDEKGVIKFTYGNGETRTGPQLALAGFDDVNALELIKGAMYRAPAAVTPHFGGAGTGSLGLIQGGSIELSNIDLAQEFGDILIIQRGYQASSRVMTVANEMIEQLYGSSRGS